MFELIRGRTTHDTGFYTRYASQNQYNYFNGKLTFRGLI
uniref:Uncharacterized protein n=1 Tax=Anguilla anguilla TaxID=7936 RepID=A0A0E9WUK0_ANGAN